MNEKTDIQFIENLDELANELTSMRKRLDLLLWLRHRIKQEYDAVIDRLEEADLLTEDEAAERLKITPRQLADLRRSDGLPHIRLGREVRYSRKNLGEIIQRLDTGNISRRLRRVS